MSNDNDTDGTSGVKIGFFGLLGLLFIAFKLTGVITWSWWWVTAPLWGIPAIFLVPLLLMGIVGGAVFIGGAIGDRFKRR